MTTASAANWFVTQPRASLLNPLSRAALIELLADPVNAQTILTQRVPLPIANRVEVAEIEAITTLYTPILGRLNVNWLNPLEQVYLADIAADTLYSTINALSPLVWFRFLQTSGVVAANSGSVALSGTYGGGVTLNQDAPRSEVKALLFDGADDFVSFPSNAAVDALQAATWGFLCRPSSLGENNEGHLHAFAANEILRLGSGILVGNLDGTVSDGLSITDSGLTLSTWAWVFTTYDFAGDDTVHIYRNGVELNRSTATAAGGNHATLNVTHFIGNNSGGTRTFAGLIASPFLVGRVLTTTEMLAIVTASGI